MEGTILGLSASSLTLLEELWTRSGRRCRLLRFEELGDVAYRQTFFILY